MTNTNGVRNKNGAKGCELKNIFLQLACWLMSFIPDPLELVNGGTKYIHYQDASGEHLFKRGVTFLEGSLPERLLLKRLGVTDAEIPDISALGVAGWDILHTGRPKDFFHVILVRKRGKWTLRGFIFLNRVGKNPQIQNVVFDNVSVPPFPSPLPPDEEECLPPTKGVCPLSLPPPHTEDGFFYPEDTEGVCPLSLTPPHTEDGFFYPEDTEGVCPLSLPPPHTEDGFFYPENTEGVCPLSLPSPHTEDGFFYPEDTEGVCPLSLTPPHTENTDEVRPPEDSDEVRPPLPTHKFCMQDLAACNQVAVGVVRPWEVSQWEDGNSDDLEDLHVPLAKQRRE